MLHLSHLSHVASGNSIRASISQQMSMEVFISWSILIVNSFTHSCSISVRCWRNSLLSRKVPLDMVSSLLSLLVELTDEARILFEAKGVWSNCLAWDWLHFMMALSMDILSVRVIFFCESLGSDTITWVRGFLSLFVPCYLSNLAVFTFGCLCMLDSF